MEANALPGSGCFVVNADIQQRNEPTNLSEETRWKASLKRRLNLVARNRSLLHRSFRILEQPGEGW